MRGLGVFRDAFADFLDQYVLIGGSACELLLDEAGIGFRATADLDIVLSANSLQPAFGEALLGFIRAGGYETWQRGATGQRHFFRFQKPALATYPKMLEFFAPGDFGSEVGAFSRLRVDDELVSLSAIVLQPEYMGFIRDGVRQVENVSVLGTEHLIPLKAYAFVDLSMKREAGMRIIGDDIKKHKRDVFRLLQIADPQWRGSVPGPVSDHVSEFLRRVEPEGVVLSDLGILGELPVFLDLLRSLYVERSA